MERHTPKSLQLENYRYITSDCDAVATIYEYHNYTRSGEDAVALALKAGLIIFGSFLFAIYMYVMFFQISLLSFLLGTDINCGTYMMRNMKGAIYQGKVLEEDIDKALLNLFSVQIRLGLFDGNPASNKFGNLGSGNVCNSKHKKLALEATRQGIVLLKNEKNFLPLNKKTVSSLAVIGPMANSTDIGGDYTGFLYIPHTRLVIFIFYSQGLNHFQLLTFALILGFSCNPKSILEELRNYVKETSYAIGCADVACNSTTHLPKALSIARSSEYVIIVAGLDLSQETEDLDRYSLLLPGYQKDVINSVAAVTRKPLILVLTGGGPIDVLFAEKDPRIASILWIGYPGETGGKALSEILFGDYNPGQYEK